MFFNLFFTYFSLSVFPGNYGEGGVQIYRGAEKRLNWQQGQKKKRKEKNTVQYSTTKLNRLIFQKEAKILKNKEVGIQVF